MESANALVAALRNQRQELLAQIETLQQVKPAEDKGPVPAEKSDERAVISFDAPQQNESEAEQTVSAPAAEPVSCKRINRATHRKSEIRGEPEAREETSAQGQSARKPVEESADDDFPGLDTFGDNWLIPTRPDTPEMIAKRKEERRKNAKPKSGPPWSKRNRNRSTPRKCHSGNPTVR